jgi:hypothetical protein
MVVYLFLLGIPPRLPIFLLYLYKKPLILLIRGYAMLRAWRCGMLDEDMVQFSVTVTLDGKSIDDIAQAIYGVLKHEHEVAFVDVMDNGGWE